jgi:transposase
MGSSGKEAVMRGKPNRQPNMFYSFCIEDRIRPDHPLRAIKKLVDEDLSRLGRVFARAYSDTGRPSVPPERLLKAMLLQALYSIRSERQLVERIDTDLLFRWFLGMDPAQEVFDATAFTHNRQRLDQHGITASFFSTTVKRAMKEGLASDEHFSVDGTLIESHASIKSFVPRDSLDKKDSDADSNRFKSRNPEVNFHGQRRSNATHVSKTDPEARLFKKGDGQAAKLYHMGHALAENRHGLILAVDVSAATGDAEPAAALRMLDHLKNKHRIRVGTCGSDKGYDSGPFLLALEARKIVPHVAVKEGKIGGRHIHRRRDQEAIAARQRMRQRMRSLGYRLSQRTRKKIEEAFGWLKSIAGLARTRLVGRSKLRQQVQMAAAAYNLVRMTRLLAR